MAEDEKKQEKEERLPAQVRAGMLADQKGMLYNVALFEHAQRVAQMYSASTMIPEHFKGNVGNCFIALNYAQRIGADEFMVMQNMYVVHGRPGIEGKLVIALVNGCGKYKRPGLYYEERGNLTSPKNDEDGMRAYAFDATTGERVNGPWITWGVVKAEGWLSKTGSKWKTMSEIMFTYRAASWFANRHCPEVKMGMATVEELHDIVEMKQVEGTYQPDLAKKLDEATAPEFPEDLKRAAAAHTDEGLDEDQYHKPEPKKQPKAPIGWDPYNEPVQQRYKADKLAVLEAELDKYGVDWKKSWTGAQKHQAVLDYAPPAEPEPESEPPDDDELHDLQAQVNSFLQDDNDKLLLADAAEAIGVVVDNINVWTLNMDTCLELIQRVAQLRQF